MKGHLRIDTFGCPNQIESGILHKLCPEYEWLGKWLPCNPAVSVRRFREGFRHFLQPLLWANAAGVPVPYSSVVRFRPTDDAVLRHVVQFYREQYRLGPVQDRLAAFANAMQPDKPNRRKKGGA